MFYIQEKLKQRIAQIEPYRYLNRTPISGLKKKEDTTKSQKYPPAVDDSWEDVEIGSFWEGRDRYIWIQAELSVPVLKDECDFVLLFDFGKTGGGHNSGFESTLFIDGVPYQGVDSNHKEVFLTKEFSGKTINIALKLWSGLEGGGPKKIMRHQLKYADYATISPQTDNFYYTTKAILDTISLLDKNSHEFVQLENLLEKVYKIIDWSDPGSGDFYKSVELANNVLTDQIETLQKNTPIEVCAIGHTHIDVAWLWQLKHTREKTARSFATVLRLMEKYPNYIFVQSQPQLYSYIKEDYPEIYSQMKQRIKEGRWEADGGMWVEADCNISSGESLVRQILHGSQFVREEFGLEMSYLWLPDVFGYSWALPQILKKSGLNTFMTTKISWNQYNRMPHDTFIWRGIDGTEILTHFITTPDVGAESTYYTYNGKITPESVKGIYNTYRNKDINSNLLLSYGYGDGGGGVNRDMLENIRIIDKIPGLPHIKTGNVHSFFDKLHDTVSKTDGYVHTWDGELYLEYHRGTYTSQAFVKKYNRKLELLYREVEILHSWGLLQNRKWIYPKEKIYKGWETILLNQFHDIIPGSSINEVYKDAKQDYETATQLGYDIEKEFVQNFVGEKEGALTIFNTAGWERQGLVQVCEKETGYFVDSEGNRLLSTRANEHYVVETPVVQPLSSATVYFNKSEVADDNEKPFSIEGTTIQTPFYIISWNEQGRLVKIFDKENNRNVITENGFGNSIELYEDKPMQYDAWDIDLYHFQKKEVIDATHIDVKEITELYATIQFTYNFKKSKIIQDMTVYKNNRRIDFKTEVHWQQRQELLKAAFDINLRATTARYQIQYGSVSRNTHWNTTWDMAQFESVAHQWVDFAQRDYGVALLNDCKYGHHVKDQTMTISLLKGAIYPDPEADIGTHNFTYSLLPHKGDFVQGNVMQQAWEINRPFEVYKGAVKDKTLIKTNGEPIAIEAIKEAQNGEGIIIRLHEHTGSNRTITLEPQYDFQAWVETDLMERPTGSPNNSKEITFELSPFEIKTVLIKL